MKNPYDVLRMKEQELLRIGKEMEALRMAARLLGAEDPGAANGEGQPKLPRVVEMPRRGSPSFGLEADGSQNRPPSHQLVICDL